MSSVMRRLADRHEIHFLGIGYSGEIVRDRGLTIYPTNPKGGDAFAAFQAKRLIEEIRPALVLVMHDIWMFDYYLSLFGPYRDRLKVVACIPLDGRIANEEEAAPLAQADRIVAYTQFAREEFEGAFRRLREKQADRDFPAVDVIPHGVDRDRFHPFPELEQASFASEGRAHAKRRVFGDRPDAGESFVVQQELTAYAESPEWFHLGDRDIATHVLRTRLLDEGVPRQASSLEEPGARADSPCGLELELRSDLHVRAQFLLDGRPDGRGLLAPARRHFGRESVLSAERRHPEPAAASDEVERRRPYGSGRAVDDLEPESFDREVEESVRQLPRRRLTSRCRRLSGSQPRIVTSAGRPGRVRSS